jgi:hypothetical protein
MSIELEKMPKLGFGLMRLPEKDGSIELEKVSEMVDKYMAAGFNYFDTAYVYHGGKSEVAARECIVKRYPRDSFCLATKLPVWNMKNEEDRDRILSEQLERAGVDYFDFYLLHSVEDGFNYDTYEKLNCFEWGVRKKKEGKIKHFGFSYHGTPALLEKILDAHPETEFVQVQLNYVDWINPIVKAEELHKILCERNIPIIVMEPVKGGTLANPLPEITGLFRSARPDASPASWAFRFVGSLPGVMTILSGMSNSEQMADNIATFTDFEPLSANEQDIIKKAREIHLGTPTIGCTACRYCCDGCPMGIKIPDVFSLFNTIRMYKEDWRAKVFYNNHIANSARASACIGCGQCESVCPQHLPIISLLKEASEKFDKE